MTISKYFCFKLEDGVTLIGFGQLNAALFFWARFSTIEPYYMWIDMWTAIMFTLRTVYYFLMVADEYSARTKKDYFEVNKVTVFGLILTGIATVLCKWLEFGGFPLWPCLSWIMWACVNIGHFYVLKDYAGLDKGWGTMFASNSN